MNTYYTRPQIARAARLSTERVRQLHREGRLPKHHAVDIEGNALWLAEVAEAWLSERKRIKGE